MASSTLPDAPPPALDIENLSHAWPDGAISLAGLSLRLDAGESLGLIGPNGAGKTTFFLLLVGCLAPKTGVVRVDGIELSRATVDVLRARIGFAFQDADDQLFLPTVLDDVAYAPRRRGASAAAAVEQARRALERLDAGHLADRAPYRLSGGEKRLAALAGVLAAEPSLLLLDEPTGGLDPRARRRLADLLPTLPATRIVATHDLDFARATCRRLAVLRRGEMLAIGPAADILSDRAVLERSELM